MAQACLGAACHRRSADAGRRLSARICEGRSRAQEYPTALNDLHALSAMLGNSRLHSTIMPLTSQPADENWRPHDDSELEHLRRSWGGWYAVAFDAGSWTAQPHAGGQ